METNRYLGKQFGSYRLIEKLDSGGFGSVYLARHMVLANRVVAVKLLHSMYLDSQEVREGFLEEARLLEMLKHPSILPIIDINIAEDGFPYLVTEFAPGGSLRARMRLRKAEPFPLSEALQILSHVGAGLSYAHERSIIHRDLKPENILFNEKGEALLADFGLATMLATASEKYVSASGTPAYMAPEQFKGIISKESDQYALGCIAYELMTGQKPFQGNNAVEMMYQHLLEKPALPTTLNSVLPSNVEEVVLKAIAKTRQERFASVESFLQSLESAIRTKEAESNLGTEPVLSLLKTMQPGDDVTLKEKLPDSEAVQQERDAIKLLPNTNTVTLTLKNGSGNTLPLPATTNTHQAVMREESVPQVSETVKPEESLEPTRRVVMPSGAWPLPPILQQNLPPDPTTTPTTKKLEPEIIGTTRPLSPARKVSARWILSIAVALIMLAVILTPIITTNLSQARGSTSQNKTSQSVAPVSTMPTTMATSIATPRSQTPSSSKVGAKNTPKNTPTTTMVPTTTPIVSVAATPTSITPPTPTPFIVPTPTPSPTSVPAPPARLLVSKSNLYAEDDCSWGDDINESSWGCTETLSNVAGAQNSISWTSSATGSSSNSTFYANTFSPSSGTISPGQSVTVSISILISGKTSCIAPPETLLFTASTNTISVPWHCSGPLPTISPTSLGGANHTGCTLDTTGSNWLCTITITANKQGLDTWGGSSTGINGISFGDPGYGYFGGTDPANPLHAVPITATIPRVNCPATATIIISTSFSTFNVPWSC